MRKPIPFDKLTKPPKTEYYAAYSGRDVWGLGHYGMDAYNDAVYLIDLYHHNSRVFTKAKGKKLKKNLKVVKITKRVYEYIDENSGFNEAARARKK